MANEKNQLETLSAEMDSALRSARTGTALIVVLAIASSLLCGYWLNDARKKFTDATPELAANFAVSKLKEAVPEYAPKLAQAAKDAAPKLLDQVEEKLNEIPGRLSKELTDRSTAEMNKLMPQAEKDMYDTLKAALDAEQAKRTPGVTDESYAKAMIDHLAASYGDESLKLLEGVHAQYGATSGDLLTYLQRLADDKGLTRKESLQREALVTFLTISSRTQKSQAP